MIRLTILIAVLWFAAAPMAAQIFPKIERDAKAPKKAPDSDPPVVEKEPEEAPPKEPVEEPDPDGIDGKQLLARYKELLRGYDNKRKQLKVIEETTDQYHRSVRVFLTGLGLMRLGYYGDASKIFKDQRYVVKYSDTARTEILRSTIRSIRNGEAYHMRLIAVVMDRYKTFANEAEFESGWIRAEKDGRKVIKDLKNATRRGGIDEIPGELQVLELESWLRQEKGHWKTLWKAERKVEKNPSDLKAWLRLSSAYGKDFKLASNDRTSNFLKVRAILTAVREVCPEEDVVRDGLIDAWLATNRFGCFQLTQYEDFVRVKEYHTQKARSTLGAVRRKLIVARGRLAGYKNKR